MREFPGLYEKMSIILAHIKKETNRYF